MEKNKTTTYITAKNRIGCNAPIEVTDLAFIVFLVFRRYWKNLLAAPVNTTNYCIDDIKILAKIGGCKSTSTQ
jgi:hypothetical protein